MLGSRTGRAATVAVAIASAGGVAMAADAGDGIGGGDSDCSGEGLGTARGMDYVTLPTSMADPARAALDQVHY